MHSFAIKNKPIQINSDRFDRFLKAGIAAVFILALLFVAEKNSVLSSEREASAKQSRLQAAEKTVSDLEIRATQMESSQNIKAAALSANMVPAEKMRFVSVDETPIALAR